MASNFPTGSGVNPQTVVNNGLQIAPQQQQQFQHQPVLIAQPMASAQNPHQPAQQTTGPITSSGFGSFAHQLVLPGGPIILGAAHNALIAPQPQAQPTFQMMQTNPLVSQRHATMQGFAQITQPIQPQQQQQQQQQIQQQQIQPQHFEHRHQPTSINPVPSTFTTSLRNSFNNLGGARGGENGQSAMGPIFSGQRDVFRQLSQNGVIPPLSTPATIAAANFQQGLVQFPHFTPFSIKGMNNQHSSQPGSFLQQLQPSFSLLSTAQTTPNMSKMGGFNDQVNSQQGIVGFATMGSPTMSNSPPTQTSRLVKSNSGTPSGPIEPPSQARVRKAESQMVRPPSGHVGPNPQAFSLPPLPTTMLDDTEPSTPNSNPNVIVRLNQGNGAYNGAMGLGMNNMGPNQMVLLVDNNGNHITNQFQQQQSVIFGGKQNVTAGTNQGFVAQNQIGGMNLVQTNPNLNNNIPTNVFDPNMNNQSIYFVTQQPQQGYQQTNVGSFQTNGMNGQQQVFLSNGSQPVFLPPNSVILQPQANGAYIQNGGNSFQQQVIMLQQPLQQPQQTTFIRQGTDNNQPQLVQQQFIQQPIPQQEQEPPQRQPTQRTLTTTARASNSAPKAPKKVQGPTKSSRLAAVAAAATAAAAANNPVEAVNVEEPAIVVAEPKDLPKLPQVAPQPGPRSLRKQGGTYGNVILPDVFVLPSGPRIIEVANNNSMMSDDPANPAPTTTTITAPKLPPVPFSFEDLLQVQAAVAEMKAMGPFGNTTNELPEDVSRHQLSDCDYLIIPQLSTTTNPLPILDRDDHRREALYHLNALKLNIESYQALVKAKKILPSDQLFSIRPINIDSTDPTDDLESLEVLFDATSRHLFSQQILALHHYFQVVWHSADPEIESLLRIRPQEQPLSIDLDLLDSNGSPIPTITTPSQTILTNFSGDIPALCPIEHTARYGILDIKLVEFLVSRVETNIITEGLLRTNLNSRWLARISRSNPHGLSLNECLDIAALTPISHKLRIIHYILSRFHRKCLNDTITAKITVWGTERIGRHSYDPIFDPLYQDLTDNAELNPLTNGFENVCSNPQSILNQIETTVNQFVDNPALLTEQDLDSQIKFRYNISQLCGHVYVNMTTASLAKRLAAPFPYVCLSFLRRNASFVKILSRHDFLNFLDFQKFFDCVKDLASAGIVGNAQVNAV